jgi:protein-arginine kinase activator protein McsA
MQNMAVVFDEQASSVEEDYTKKVKEDSDDEELSSIRLEALKHRLTDAVNEENYELATKLRDEINRRENIS